MHYVAMIGGQEYAVEIREGEPEVYSVVIDGKSLEVDARVVSETTLSLLTNNESYNIESELAVDGSENLLVRGELVKVEVLDLRTSRLRKAQETCGGMEGPAVISSPMPGKVVAVLVEEGQEVEEGQGLVVVEAMKMENELQAPRAGVVKGLSAEEGVAVDGGASLCTIE